MKPARIALIAILLIAVLLFVPSASAELIFSRRIYRESGSSYHQVWTWDPLNGALTALTDTPRDHSTPRCEKGGITFTSQEATQLWSLDASGVEHIIGPAPEMSQEPASSRPDCPALAKSGTLEACGSDETLTISNAGKQTGRLQIETDICPIDQRGTIGKCATPIRELSWTEDGKWLLVGEEGLNDASGQRQNDYYLVRTATMKLSPVASAETAFWLPKLDRIVYQTPQHLEPLFQTRHRVWVQQLISFDPVTGQTTAITSGLSDNLFPAWCSR